MVGGETKLGPRRRAGAPARMLRLLWRSRTVDLNRRGWLMAAAGVAGAAVLGDVLLGVSGAAVASALVVVLALIVLGSGLLDDSRGHLLTQLIAAWSPRRAELRRLRFLMSAPGPVFAAEPAAGERALGGYRTNGAELAEIRIGSQTRAATVTVASSWPESVPLPDPRAGSGAVPPLAGEDAPRRPVEIAVDGRPRRFELTGTEEGWSARSTVDGALVTITAAGVPVGDVRLESFDHRALIASAMQRIAGGRG